MPVHDCPVYGRSAFEHQHLDYDSSSIRLLRVLPDLSHDGLIQCELWHATVEHEHECLSYEWKSIGKPQEILINGKSLEVSEHLWSFLKVHGPKYAASRRALWIDFICIHQECRSELNHQIRLMKRLYSSAHQVIAWLGFSKRIERAFAFWRELNTLQPPTLHETNEIWRSHIQNKNKELGKDWLELGKHSYWRRAWITQEILCATKLKLLINDSEVVVGPVPGISKLLPQYDTPSDPARVYPSLHVFHTYLEALCESRKIVGLNLVSLFDLLPGRESSKPRDRIYSLLSIASDGESVLMDYNISDEDVLFQFLETFQESVCPCFVAYMAQALEIQNSRRLVDVSEQMPLFRIAVKRALPMAAMQYTGNSKFVRCSQCRASVVDMGPGATMFCTHGQTHCLRDRHLYLQECQTDYNGKKYRIKSEHSGSWFELYSVKDVDWFTTCIESSQGPDYGSHLYLTAGVAIHLLASIFQSYQPGEIIKLCKHAQNSKGSAALCKPAKVETTSNPEPCCSNKNCMKRLYANKGDEFPEAYWHPCISQQYIQQEVRHGTWASPFVIKTFLEHPGPWVHWNIKDPRSYPVSTVIHNNVQTSARKRKRCSASRSSVRGSRQSSHNLSVHSLNLSHHSSGCSRRVGQITGYA